MMSKSNLQRLFISHVERKKEKNTEREGGERGEMGRGRGRDGRERGGEERGEERGRGLRLRGNSRLTTRPDEKSDTKSIDSRIYIPLDNVCPD